MTDSSRKWPIAFFSLLVLTVVSIGVLSYAVVDQAITLSYMSVGYADTKKDLDVLAAAFPRDRYSKKDMVTILRQQNPDAFIVETECTVGLNGLSFSFDDQGNLVGLNTDATTTADTTCSN